MIKDNHFRAELLTAMANKMIADGELPDRKIRRLIAKLTGEPFTPIPNYRGHRDLRMQ